MVQKIHSNQSAHSYPAQTIGVRVLINRQNNARHSKKNHRHLTFEGMTLILAGDWRQILPVVRHGSMPDTVDATLKSSYLWQIVTRLQLTQNMRAKLRGESSQFADFLLSIEGGKEEHHKDKGHFFIKLPDDMTVENEKELLDFVFGGIENNTQTQLGYHHAQLFVLPTVN